MRFTFRLLAAVVTVAMSVGAANAAPIVDIDGTSGFTTITPGATSFSVNFFAPLTLTTAMNNSPLVPPIPTFLANYSFSNTGIAVTGGTLYMLTSPVNSPAITITPMVGIANFDLASLVAFVPTLFPNTMTISGLTNLTLNTTSFDLSPFNVGGQYTITFNDGGNNLNSVIASGNPANSVSGSSSFSLTPAVVPEPMSLAVFGVLALGGAAAVARRKLLARRNATTVA